jgi:ParB family transcriptional regulator, chromosome partitioning protein
LRLISTSTKLSGIVEDIDISKIVDSEFLLRIPTEDGVEELAISIIEHGLLNPIVVRVKSDPKFEIVAGNRRFKACKILGYKKISCHVIELDDKKAFEISLTENIQRKRLNHIEEAQAFHKYISEFGWGGASELSRKIGKSVSYITRRIRLLELPPDVIHAIIYSEITASAAEELLSIKDKTKQSEVTKIISSKNLSVKQTRNILSAIELDTEYINGDQYLTLNIENNGNSNKYDKVIDKSISILRIAMTRLSDLILDMKDDNDANWLLHEEMMHHRIMLHRQIDQLLKRKKKKRKIYG